MTESTIDENTPLTAKDEADLKLLGDAEAPAPNTLLKVWQEVLSNIEQSASERVTPALANRIVSSWPKLSFQDTPDYHKLYHGYLMELREILHDAIRKNPDALKNVDDDAEANRDIYLGLLLDWQIRIAEWEHAWDASAADAHIKLAAIADATVFFVGQNGLVEHLSQINFQFSDADRDELGEKLLEAKAAL